MAAALPELQDAYPAMYRALTMGERHLSQHEKECVWLAILTACQEHVGTHHVAAFRECGGTNIQAQAILQVAALALGASTVFGFVDEHWAGHLGMDEAVPLYQSAISRTCETAQLDPNAGFLMALGVHTAFSHAWGIGTALRICYKNGVHEGKMAEAMSLALWPCGMNRFVTAAFIWRDLILSGKVPASAGFLEWARTPDQDGFAGL